MNAPQKKQTEKIVDIELWFDPDTKNLLLGGPDGEPIGPNTGYLTNQFFSTLVLRLRTCGLPPLKYNFGKIAYDWPSDKYREKAANYALFPYHPLTWVTPDKELILPSPSNTYLSHGNSGTTLTIGDLNVFKGWKDQTVTFHFMISVFYKGMLYPTDPVIINEPYEPTDLR